MIVGASSCAASAHRASGSHYCPCCLRWVGAAEAARRTHQQACRSGELDVSLLTCPACGLVLAAELETNASADRPAA